MNPAEGTGGGRRPLRQTMLRGSKVVKLKIFRRELPMHLMLLPSVVVVLIFSYGPIAGLVMAFQDFQEGAGWFGSPWVGLDNFKFLLILPGSLKSLWNTIYIAFGKGLFGLITPLVAALLLNELRSVHYKRTLQTILYLPHFLSWVILSGILIDVLSPSSGIVNNVLKLFGIEPIFFLGDNRWFPVIAVATDIWKEFGFNSVVFLAALAGIDPTYYDAATVDGAGHFRRLWHITLPNLSPMLVMLALLNLGNILNAGFDQIFNLYSPVVYESGDIIDTFVYRTGIRDALYSVAAAAGFFKSVVSLLLLSTSYYLAYRFADYRIF
jgi:putative aldouronate transport system permease protein